MSTAAKVTAYAADCIAVLCASAGIAGYLTAFIERDGLGITYLTLTVVGVVALVTAAVAYTYTAITDKK